jgi:(S)-ureidoglycine aminohydrolase
MELFGSTRSCVARKHALITPDTNVPSVPPGWDKAKAFVLISPQMGASFTQYLAHLEPGASAAPPLPGVERVIFVLEGKVELNFPEIRPALQPGGYAYFPPNLQTAPAFRAVSGCRLNVFEKRYSALPGVVPPKWRYGQEQDVPGEPFLGDPDARLKVLLPTTLDFDMAVNVFTYQPGAALPQVEIHVMEHGLLMLAGQGVSILRTLTATRWRRPMIDLRVNIDRLAGELEQLATFNDTEPPAVTRILYTDNDLEARAYLKRLCTDAGLVVREDPIGNLFAIPPYPPSARDHIPTRFHFPAATMARSASWAVSRPSAGCRPPGSSRAGRWSW